MRTALAPKTDPAFSVQSGTALDWDENRPFPLEPSSSKLESTTELSRQLQAAQSQCLLLDSQCEQLHSTVLLKDSQVSLLRSHCSDLSSRVTSLKQSQEALKADKAALKADISTENAALSALDSQLYKKEQRLKDLKRQLQTATEELKCKDLEDYEVEEEYQEALCHCEQKQKKQREAVARSLKQYDASLAVALSRVETLRTELDSEKAKNKRKPLKTVSAQRPSVAVGWALSLFAGVAVGVGSRWLLFSGLAVA